MPDSIKPGTPLPWIVSEYDGVPEIRAEIHDEQGECFDIAVLGTGNGPDGAEKQDAAYIVHAANSLPSLEAENKRLREALARAGDVIAYLSVSFPVGSAAREQGFKEAERARATIERSKS